MSGIGVSEYKEKHTKKGIPTPRLTLTRQAAHPSFGQAAVVLEHILHDPAGVYRARQGRYRALQGTIQGGYRYIQGITGQGQYRVNIERFMGNARR